MVVQTKHTHTLEWTLWPPIISLSSSWSLDAEILWRETKTDAYNSFINKTRTKRQRFSDSSVCVCVVMGEKRIVSWTTDDDHLLYRLVILIRFDWQTMFVENKKKINKTNISNTNSWNEQIEKNSMINKQKKNNFITQKMNGMQNY